MSEVSRIVKKFTRVRVELYQYYIFEQMKVNGSYSRKYSGKKQVFD